MKKTITRTAALFAVCLAMTANSAVAGAEGAPFTRRSQSYPAQQSGMQLSAPGMDDPFGIEAGSVRISEPGNYTLTGQMQGTVFVDPGYGQVNITFDGVNIDGQHGPAIAAISGDKLNINIAGGSSNYLGGSPDSSFGAVFYSSIPVEIGGSGRLDMMSMGTDVFRIENNDITFSGGDIRMQAAGYGIDAPNAIFNGGNVIVNYGYAGVAPGTGVTMGGGTFAYGSMSTGSYSGMNGYTSGMSGFGGSTGSGSFSGTGGFGGNQFSGGDQPFGGTGSQPGGAQSTGSETPTTDTAGEIVSGITQNSAMSLTADYDNAVTYDVSEDSEVKITSSGTYIVTGSASEGSITVKKGTTGVVLVLQDLDLTSTSGAVLSVNKEAEVQIVISGSVTLTDNEDPNDENSSDADVADAFDGAAIKIKAGANAYITGDGTLNINGNAKNGIKAGDDTSLVIGGGVTLNITAVNDGINGSYDIAILSGNVNISAGDDGIHADHILTVGKDGTGPVINIRNSTEGIEGTVVNIAGGNLTINASDDAINAANGDGTYEGVLGYSINMTGGTVNANAGTDGLDSNGNVNLIGGSLTIRSANNGGDAGIDYDGDYYLSSGFSLNNSSGVAGPDGMPGQMGGMPGNMPGGMRR